jgi:hypothetical protein
MQEMYFRLVSLATPTSTRTGAENAASAPGSSAEACLLSVTCPAGAIETGDTHAAALSLPSGTPHNDTHSLRIRRRRVRAVPYPSPPHTTSHGESPRLGGTPHSDSRTPRSQSRRARAAPFPSFWPAPSRAAPRRRRGTPHNDSRSLDNRPSRVPGAPCPSPALARRLLEHGARLDMIRIDSPAGIEPLFRAKVQPRESVSRSSPGRQSRKLRRESSAPTILHVPRSSSRNGRHRLHLVGVR